MYNEKKRVPRVIWEKEISDVTLSAIEQGYCYGKCGLRMTRRNNGKILQNYASYIPAHKLEGLLDKLDGDIQPKEVLLSQRDEISAQACKQSGFARKDNDLCKTLLITSTESKTALLQSTVQWGSGKPRTVKAEITLDNLYNMFAAMESSYRAYQLCKATTGAGRMSRSKMRGLDINAA